ncbi:MAG: hypothetical protein FWE47_03075, partial [Oscillospiraceae bacterium]|nr:hypothetical protein [Oscillospiraceae bacterium]
MAKYKKNDGDAFDDGSVRPLFGDDEEFGPDYNDQSNDLINRKKGGIDFSHGGSGFAATAEDALKEEEKAKALEEAQEKMNKYLLEKDVKKAELAKKRAEQRKVARQKAQQEYSDAAKISKDEKRAARQETVAEGHSRQAEIHQAEAQLAEATKKEIEKENVIHSARQEVDVHSDVVGMKEHGTKEQTEDHLEKAEKQREERIFQEEISKEELKAETKAQFDKDRADMDARLAEQEAKYTEIAEQQSAAVRNETVAADLAGKEAEKLRREENARKTKEAYISEADERKKIELAKKGEYESYEAKKLDLEIKKTEKAYSQQLGLDPDLVEKEYRKAQREAKKSCESITETRMREAMEQDGIRTQIATKQEQLRANQEAKFFQDRAETEEGQQLKKQQKKMLEAKADAKPETKKILTTPEVIKDASQAKSRLVDQMAMSLKRKVSRITDIDKRIAEINEGLKAGNIMQSNANKSIFMLMRERNKLLGTIKDKKILSKFGYKAPVALAKKIGGAKGAAGRRLGNAVLGTRFGKQVMAISRKLEKTTIARQFKRGVKGVNKLGAKGMAIAAQAGKNMAQTRQQIRVLLKKNRRML